MNDDITYTLARLAETSMKQSDSIKTISNILKDISTVIDVHREKIARLEKELSNLKKLHGDPT